MVGTRPTRVTLCRSISCIASSGSKRGAITSVPPSAGSARSGIIEAAWKIGVGIRNTCSSPIGNTIARWYQLSISARWLTETPLGSPVVPPVYMRTTGSSSSGSSGTSGSLAASSSS